MRLHQLAGAALVVLAFGSLEPASVQAMPFPQLNSGAATQLEAQPVTYRGYYGYNAPYYRPYYQPYRSYNYGGYYAPRHYYRPYQPYYGGYNYYRPYRHYYGRPGIYLRFGF